MMYRSFSLTLCFVEIIALLFSTGGLACSIDVLTTINDTGTRIASASIIVRNAALTSIERIPPGWRIEIVNDARWEVRVTGRALVGAAFLDDLDFVNALRFSPQPGHQCDTLDRISAADVEFGLYISDTISAKRLNSAQIKIRD